MRTRRRTHLLAAVFTTGLLFGLSGAAHAETLGEAIAMAYDSNPAILIARSQLRQADELFYRTVRSTLGPTLAVDVTVGATHDIDLIDGLRTDSRGPIGLSASASQPIYSGGRINATLRSQEASLLQQRESLRSAEQTLVQQVVTAYVNVRRAEQTLEIARQSVRNNDTSRNEAQARFEVGSSTQTELAQAQTRYAQAQTSAIQAETTLQNSRAAYAQVVGQLPGTLVEEPSLDAALPANAEQALSIAFENNPTLRQRYLAERASANGITSARAARKPRVSATLRADADDAFIADTNGTRLPNSAGLTTGVTLSVPLYSGLTTSSSIRSAVETNKSDNIQIEQQRRTVQQQIVSGLNTLNSQRAVIASNQEAVRSAKLTLEGSVVEQQVGIRTPLDVLNSEQELRQQEQNLINARFSAYTAAVDLLAAMGKLDPRLFNASIVAYDPIAHFDEVNGFELPWEPLIRRLDQIGVDAPPERPVTPGVVEPTLPVLNGE